MGGKNKIELYRNGWRKDQALHIYSTTASVTAALIGIAIDDEVIGGLDDTLVDLLPRYEEFMSTDAHSITLRQLMNMTAGFPYDFAVDQVATKPAFTGRATVGDPAFDARTDFGWGTDAAGLNSGCCLLRLTPVDMAKIGELFRSDGLWRGSRIMPTGWAGECTRQGRLSADFGLLWYTTTMRGHAVWLSRGGEGQLIAIVPDRELAVVVASVGTKEFHIPEYDASSFLNNVTLPAIG